MHSIPDELVDAVISDRLVVLVGAGASRSAGFPSWPALLRLLLQRAQSTLPVGAPDTALTAAETIDWFSKDDDLITKASFLREQMGADWIADVIVGEFGRHTTKPSDIHDSLASFSRAVFITTNYDLLLEEALEQKTGVPPLVARVDDIAAVASLGPGQVLKLHGDIKQPSTIVLAEEDYFRIGYTGSTAWKFRLQSLLQNPHRLLIVGYGYGDPDVQHVFNQLRAAYGVHLRAPLWLTTGGVRAKAFATSMHLEAVFLEHYKDTAPWLDELAKAVASKRSQAPLVVQRAAYADLAHEHLRKAQQRAGELFNEQRYGDAESAYSAVLVECEHLLEKDPTAEEFKTLATSCKVNIGGCMLCLQRNDEARTLLTTIGVAEAQLLPDEGLASLAEALAQLGDLSRAELLLALPSPIDEGRTRREQGRELIKLLRGEVQEQYRPPTPTLALVAARATLSQGLLDQSAELALETIRLAPEHILIRLYSLDAMLRALGASVFESTNSRSWVPTAQRARLVESLESGILWLSQRVTEPASRADLMHLRASFYGLTLAEDLDEGAAGSDEGDQTEEEIAFLRALDLAGKGELAAAVASLPPSDHPWSRGLEIAQLKRKAGNFEAALADARFLVERYPARAPLEFLAAKLLAEGGRAGEARTHAALAFEALPGRGYRVLLAQCLQADGKHSEALDVLEPLGDTTTPRVLRLRARALEAVEPRRAVNVWRQLRVLTPTDPTVSLNLARAVFGVGEHREAADVAWEVFSSFQETLDPQMLYHCCVFQRLGCSTREAHERVQAVVRVLQRRFPNSPEASQYRLMLRTGSSVDSNEPPIDLKKLEDAGILQSISLDQVSEMLRSDFKLREGALRLYNAGHLPFERLCKLTRTRSASYILRFSQATESRGPAFLTPPVQIETPTPPLRGLRLLVSDLEVLLLIHLKLESGLREAVGDSGRLIIFRDIWQALTSDAIELKLAVDEASLQQELRLLDKIQNHARIKTAAPSDTLSDDEWATRENVVILEANTAATMGCISPRKIAEHMSVLGHITGEQLSSLRRALPEESSAHELPSPLPSRFAIGIVPLEVFFAHDVLDALLDLVGETLLVGPSATSRIQQRVRELRQAAAEANLAHDAQIFVGQGISEGWVEVIERPKLANLPPTRNANVNDEELFRAALHSAYSYREALRSDPNLWLLTADSFVSSPLGSHPEMVFKLAWPSSEDYLDFAEGLRELSSREFRFPGLVRELLADEAKSKFMVILTELGFADALRSEDILYLARQYGGLDKPSPRRILDRAERMARDPNHADTTTATLRVAIEYGAAAVAAFIPGDSTPLGTSPEALVDSILKRVEELGSTALDLTLQFAVLKTMSDPGLSFVAKPSDESRRVPSLESVAGRFLSCLSTFGSVSSSRRAACGRALRLAWLSLDDLLTTVGPNPIQCMPLLLCIGVAPSHLKQVELETPAILSGVWKNRPLAEIRMGVDIGGDQLPSVEDTLVRLAKLLENPSRVAVSDSELQEVLPNGAPSEDVVAPESILLRAAPAAACQFAVFLASRQGPHDGRAHDLLLQLANAPEAPDLKRQYARLTIAAPWRAVREDPSVLATWALRARMGGDNFPQNIADLRALLSEPPDNLDAGRTLWDILADRASEGGVWHGRDDLRILFPRAAEIPGMLSAASLGLRLESSLRARHLNDALRRVENPIDVPATRLCGDVFLLCVGFALSLDEEHNGVELRERLPRALLKLLDPRQSSPTDSGQAETEAFRSVHRSAWETMAGSEVDLLRLCARTVGDLCHRQALPLRDGLFLTFRLFGWLEAQLSAVAPSVRATGINALRKLAPPVETLAPGTEDVMNPLGFDANALDFRLSAILVALANYDEVIKLLPKDLTEGKSRRSPVESLELQKILVALSCRPLSDREASLRKRGDLASVLDWLGPSAVSDLALSTLLDVNPKCFLELPPDVRLRFIHDLPGADNTATAVPPSLSVRVFRAATMFARELTNDEKTTFEERLRALQAETDRRFQTWRWLGFTQLFAAGHFALEQEVLELLLERLGDELAPTAFGAYLVGVGSADPSRLEDAARGVCEHGRSIGIDTTELYAVAARVTSSAEATEGSPPAAP